MLCNNQRVRVKMSRNAASAKDLSLGANDVAEHGGRVVEQAVSAMGNIEKSS